VISATSQEKGLVGSHH